MVYFLSGDNAVQVLGVDDFFAGVSRRHFYIFTEHFFFNYLFQLQFRDFSPTRKNCEHPTLYFREDCWVVEWGENNEHSVRIEKGDDYSELIEDGETEYTKVEEA